MTWYQEWFGEEYLELYAHRDENEARRQVAFFREHAGRVDGVDPRSRLRHRTSSHGAECRGISTPSAAISRSRCCAPASTNTARCRSRAPTCARLPFGSGSFDGLVNFFTSFGYFATEDENLQVVREMARVLRPGGVFLFDYLNVDRELDKLVRARDAARRRAGASRSSAGSIRVTVLSTNGSRSVKSVTWSAFAGTISTRSRRCSLPRAFRSAKRSAISTARRSTPPRRA